MTAASTARQPTGILALSLCFSVVYLELAGQEPAPTLFAERDGLIVMEAEQAQDLGGYRLHQSALASGGAYVSSGGCIRFRIVVMTRGRWSVHLRTQAKDDKGNSCFLQVNGKAVIAPPGIAHHRGVIQTTIGTWKWWNKWRESANIPVTVDLAPRPPRHQFFTTRTTTT